MLPQDIDYHENETLPNFALQVKGGAERSFFYWLQISNIPQMCAKTYVIKTKPKTKQYIVMSHRALISLPE